MLIMYFFQMVLNTCEMWSKGIKIAFFSKKFQKIAQRLGASSPDPLCDTFEYTTFSFVTFGLSPLPLENSRLSAKPGHGFWSSILRYLCPTKTPLSNISDDFIACDFVIFGLPPPNQKPWLRLCTGDGISSRVPPNHWLSSASKSKLL